MHPIYLHNTLTGKKELFTPMKEHEVSMYHCGPTVYNYLHIGNLRSYVLADTLRRMFEANSYKIHQVINITDVGHLTANNDEGLGDDGEDKMEKMAKTAGKTAQEIAGYYTDIFFTDIQALNVETDGTIFPKASEHIPEQIEMIKILETKGFTYQTSDGVYFDTSKYADYGKLGNINLEGLREGSRIGTNDEKKNLTDFALWKFSKAGEKRFQEWPSPWGVGFPGWHIECSAMSSKYLGDTFDIHTGGIDHIPVHHNNEIAQSECAHSAPLAHYWLHNAFVNSDGKMSKSKGDFTRLETLIEKGIQPVEYRYWLLQAHYSSQVQYTEEAVRAGSNGYRNLVSQVAGILKNKSEILNGRSAHEDAKQGSAISSEEVSRESTETTSTSIGSADSYMNSFMEKINNDLDTPQCIAFIWELVKDEKVDWRDAMQAIKKMDAVLGLDLIANAEIFNKTNAALSELEIPADVLTLLNERKNAREEKNWKASDELRDKIKSLGFVVKDTDGGQTLTK